MDPLDLFSDQNEQQQQPQQHEQHQVSSPVEESDALKQLKMDDELGALLDRRNELKARVVRLESQLNDLKSLQEEQDSRQKEAELLQRLLAGPGAGPGGAPSPDMGAEDAPGGASAGSGDDLDAYDAKPLKDWSIRTEYLKKLYPSLDIDNISTEHHIEHNSGTPILVKIISFTVRYRKIRLEIGIEIVLKKDAVLDHVSNYTVDKLNLTRLSNNRYNTLVMELTEFYERNKNVNEFLFQANELYLKTVERLHLFQQLSEHYQLGPQGGPSATSSTLTIDGRISILYDICFQNGEIVSLLSVDNQHNNVLDQLVRQQGLLGGLKHLIDLS